MEITYDNAAEREAILEQNTFNNKLLQEKDRLIMKHDNKVSKDAIGGTLVLVKEWRATGDPEITIEAKLAAFDVRLKALEAK